MPWADYVPNADPQTAPWSAPRPRRVRIEVLQPTVNAAVNAPTSRDHGDPVIARRKTRDERDWPGPEDCTSCTKGRVGGPREAIERHAGLGLPEPVPARRAERGEGLACRRHVIAVSALSRLLLCVFVERDGDVFRIISARKVTKHERRRYEEDTEA